MIRWGTRGWGKEGTPALVITGRGQGVELFRYYIVQYGAKSIRTGSVLTGQSLLLKSSV
jgi:hypothetical protein